MKKNNKKVETKITKRDKQDKYEASVSIFGITYKSIGDTIEEAISSLDVKKYRGKAILSITHGNDRKDRILSPISVNRLFNTRGITREVAIKQYSNLFK